MLSSFTDRPKQKIAAVVLAGGKASRYDGACKGLLEITPGVPILSRLIVEIRASGLSDIAISANDPEPYTGFQLPIIEDIRQGLGPVGGIEAGLMYFGDRFDGTLFLPSDLPGITRREISTLVEAFGESEVGVVFASDGSFFDHPLCAVVHNGLLPELTGAIDAGQRKLTDIWAGFGAVSVKFNETRPFYNVNTPADLVQWREQQLSKPRILVPNSLLDTVEVFLRSENLALDVVTVGDADIRVVQCDERAESDGTTLKSGGWIRCSVALEIGDRLNIDPKQVGGLLNLLDIKVRACELGCF